MKRDNRTRRCVVTGVLMIAMAAVRWALLASATALREVLGYKMGVVSFSMATGTNSGIGASLSIKTVQ